MRCIVVRDGKESEIEARDLVPGDIIILEEGTNIPADARVIIILTIDNVPTNDPLRS